MATSPGFNQKATTHDENRQFQPRRKRPPPSQGFTSLHWIKKHEKLKSMAKYGGPGQYTMEEIKKHNKRDDCWIVLNGHIFDITEYIPYHPGGDEILRAKGRDGTILFYSTHRWVNIEALIKNCWIGQVLNYKPPNLKRIGTSKHKSTNKQKNDEEKQNDNAQMNPNERNKKEAMSRSRQLIRKQNQIANNMPNKDECENKKSDEKQKPDHDIQQIAEATQSLEIEKEEDLEELQ